MCKGERESRRLLCCCDKERPRNSWTCSMSDVKGMCVLFLECTGHVKAVQYNLYLCIQTVYLLDKCMQQKISQVNLCNLTNYTKTQNLNLANFFRSTVCNACLKYVCIPQSLPFLFQVICSLETEPDINQELSFFSYEHFYVLYCKFWELDTDHDLVIDAKDLSRHEDHGASTPHTHQPSNLFFHTHTMM